ncbi:MAG: trypsin-like peptidase domain-containing protein [Phycisphaerae bacterium]|nr:trypsin-like peptidase domain-containing protein [Phycisphaerae bacterium]
MSKQAYVSGGLAFLLIATVFTVAFCHADLATRVAYGSEHGKLDADVEPSGHIDTEDAATLEQVSHALSVIAEEVKGSVVNIEARASFEIDHEAFRRRFSDRANPFPPSKGTGSGIIYDDKGHIITSNHVIAHAEVIDVTLANGDVYRAEVVGTDPKTDLALIKINANGLHPARLGDSDRMRVGNLVLAIGSPFKFGQSVTHGIVSALGRADVPVGIDYQNWIQTDAPINPGNSGGPLINTRGEVIGINTAIATECGGYQGVGFAIPSNTVARVANLLKSGEPIQRGYLGVVIQAVTPKMASACGLDEARGVFVDGVGPGTPAAKGGLQPEDVILAINDEKIETREQLQEIVAATEPGASVGMTVWRGGAARQLTVPIGLQPVGFSTTGSIADLHRWRDDPDDDEEQAAPDGQGDAEEAPDRAQDEEVRSNTEVDFDELGFSADTVSPRLKELYGLDPSIQSGALVTRVSPVGEAYAAKLRPGQVIAQANGRRIHNVSELQQALTKAAVSRGVRLKVEYGTDAFYAVLQVR